MCNAMGGTWCLIRNPKVAVAITITILSLFLNISNKYKAAVYGRSEN